MNSLERQLYQNAASPSLASVSTDHPAIALGDLAMTREDVKGRLAPIAAYAVANPRNEFVLISSSSSSIPSDASTSAVKSASSAPLGLFFFNKEDAHHLIRRVRESNPVLGREAKVLRVTLDNVFDVFSAPREVSGLRGIQFRFMPDMNQVRHAIDLYRTAGVETRAFVGVPVFQAEGLTVTAHDAQYVPLFLTREDLDVAAAAAHRQRNAVQIREYGTRAAALAEELDAIRRDIAVAEQQQQQQHQVPSGAKMAIVEDAKGHSDNSKKKTTDDADKKISHSKVLQVLRSKEGQAKERLEVARLKVAAVEAMPPPKVEVGSLEEVIMRMSTPKATAAEMAAWAQVMFVAPDLLRSAAGAKLQGSSLSREVRRGGGKVREGEVAPTTSDPGRKPNVFESLFRRRS